MNFLPKKKKKSAMNSKPALISLGLFPGMIFQYLTRPPRCRRASDCCGGCRACNVCGTTVRGSVYHCRETGFDVHPKCADLKTKIQVEQMEFELCKGGHSKCNWCKNKKLKGSVKHIPGYCYVSRDDKHSFHVYCLMDMGVEYGSSSASLKLNSGDGDVAKPELRLVKKKSPDWESAVRRLGKVVGLFLKIVLSVLFGDPTMILTSVAVHLLKP